MIGAHILDGDIVILEQSKEVHNGDIVAATIDVAAVKKSLKDAGFTVPELSDFLGSTGEQ